MQGLLDGLKISPKNMLMVYGDQVVTGRKIVRSNVTVHGSLTVNGLINLINLNDVVNRAIQRDRKYNVTGTKIFTQTVTAVSLQAPTVAGIDILQLQDKLNATLDVSDLENRLEEIEGVLSHMQEAFNSKQ